MRAILKMWALIALFPGGGVFAAPALTWEEFSSPLFSAGATVFKDTFVASGRGGVIHLSTDGSTWASLQVATNDFYAVVSTDELAVAVGQEGQIVNWNGEVWRNVGPNNPDYDFFGIAHGNGVFVAVTADVVNTVGSGSAFTSPDGTNWSEPVKVHNDWLTSVAFGNGYFIAAGYGGVYRSTNGQEWTTLPEFPLVRKIFFAGDKFWLQTGRSNPEPARLFSSSNGESWKEVEGVSPGLTSNVLQAGGLYVMLKGNHLFTSADGESWTDSSTSLVETYSELLFEKNRFYAKSSRNFARSSPVFPFLTATRNGSGEVNLRVFSEGNQPFVIEGSSDLAGWSDLGSISVVGGNGEYQFFRARSDEP